MTWTKRRIHLDKNFAYNIHKDGPKAFQNTILCVLKALFFVGCNRNGLDICDPVI